MYDPVTACDSFTSRTAAAGCAAATRRSSRASSSSTAAARYRVVRVESTANPRAFGHVWAELIES